MKKLLFLAWLVLMFASATGSVQAQWTNIAPNLFPSYTGGDGHYALSFRDGILWLVTEDLYMSTDSGSSWSKPCQKIPWTGAALDIQFFDRQYGIASSFTGAWLTEDHAVTWRKVCNVGIYGASFGNSPKIFALAGFGITTDAGASWKYGAAGAADVKYLKDGKFLTIGDGTTYTTQDCGRNWQFAYGIIHRDSYSFAIDSCDPNLIYCPSENWMLKADNT